MITLSSKSTPFTSLMINHKEEKTRERKKQIVGTDLNGDQKALQNNKDSLLSSYRDINVDQYFENEINLKENQKRKKSRKQKHNRVLSLDSRVLQTQGDSISPTQDERKKRILQRNTGFGQQSSERAPIAYRNQDEVVSLEDFQQQLREPEAQKKMFLNMKKEIDPNYNPELVEQQKQENKAQLENLGLLDESAFENHKSHHHHHSHHHSKGDSSIRQKDQENLIFNKYFTDRLLEQMSKLKKKQKQKDEYNCIDSTKLYYSISDAPAELQESVSKTKTIRHRSRKRSNKSRQSEMQSIVNHLQSADSTHNYLIQQINSDQYYRKNGQGDPNYLQNQNYITINDQRSQDDSRSNLSLKKSSSSSFNFNAYLMKRNMQNVNESQQSLIEPDYQNVQFYDRPYNPLLKQKDKTLYSDLSSNQSINNYNSNNNGNYQGGNSNGQISPFNDSQTQFGEQISLIRKNNQGSDANFFSEKNSIPFSTGYIGDYNTEKLSTNNRDQTKNSNNINGVPSNRVVSLPQINQSSSSNIFPQYNQDLVQRGLVRNYDGRSYSSTNNLKPGSRSDEVSARNGASSSRFYTQTEQESDDEEEEQLDEVHSLSGNDAKRKLLIENLARISQEQSNSKGVNPKVNGIQRDQNDAKLRNAMAQDRQSSAGSDKSKDSKFTQEFTDFQVKFTKFEKEKPKLIDCRVLYGFLKEPLEATLQLKVYDLQTSPDYDWQIDQVWTNFQEKETPEIKMTAYIRGRLKNSGDNQVLIEFHPFQQAVEEQTDFLKDKLIQYYLNQHFTSLNQKNLPCPLLLDEPVIFQQSQNLDFEFVTQQEYNSNLEAIIELRHNLVNKVWEEDDLLQIFYSLLHALDSIHRLNFVHASLTPQSITYCYQSERYQLTNFRHSFVNHSNANQKKPFYVTTPYIPPEMRVHLYELVKSTQNENIQYNAIAVDYFCLGLCFLFMQFLVTENSRDPDNIKQQMSLLKSTEHQKDLSSSIILSLLEQNPAIRMQKSLSLLLSQIQENLSKQKQFTEFRTAAGYTGKAVIPVPLSKWGCSREPDPIAEFYFRAFQTKITAQRYQWISDACRQENPLGTEYLISLRRLWLSLYRRADYVNAYKYNCDYFALQSTLQPQIQNQLCFDLRTSGDLKLAFERKEEALADFQKALDMFISLNGSQDSRVLEFMARVAYLNFLLKKYDDAIRFYKNVIEKMRELDIKDSHYIENLENLGDAFLVYNQDKEALENLEEAYELRQQNKENTDKVVTTGLKLAQHYFSKQKDFKKSKAYVEQCLEIKEDITTIPENQDLLEIKYFLAKILFQLQEKQQAFSLLDQNIENLRRRNRLQSSSGISALTDTANLITQYGYKDQAIQYYNEALEISKGQMDSQKNNLKVILEKVDELQYGMKKRNFSND